MAMLASKSDSEINQILDTYPGDDTPATIAAINQYRSENRMRAFVRVKGAGGAGLGGVSSRAFDFAGGPSYLRPGSTLEAQRSAASLSPKLRASSLLGSAQSPPSLVLSGDATAGTLSNQLPPSAASPSLGLGQMLRVPFTTPKSGEGTVGVTSGQGSGAPTAAVLASDAAAAASSLLPGAVTKTGQEQISSGKGGKRTRKQKKTRRSP